MYYVYLCSFNIFKRKYFVIFWKPKAFYKKTCIITLSSILHKNKTKIKNVIKKKRKKKRNFLSRKYVLETTQCNGGKP